MVINITNQDYSNIKAIANKHNCTITENASMKDFTTFKTGGICPLVVSPSSTEALSEIITECLNSSIPYTVLGNGSNVLVSDDGIDGVVIHIADGLNNISLINETTIFCEAGLKLGALCNFALDNSLGGLEFAFGIPGSVGGAIFMNAGAYGGEMKDVVTKVYHIDKNGAPGVLTAEELKFGYRTSAYENNGFIVTGVELELKKADKTQIKETMNELLNRRKDKQPLEFPSAGSTFKRPEGHFAGALIEQCGLKGKQIGGARVSEKHAGFIINADNATTDDIFKLIEFVKETVKKETGVTLSPEVRILR
ncbi:MAG: UDP-N-acetylmuramate dehydrogenase [Clostridia bacterium]|nr:UDP-N-acetylmuramate dehydrogenase [Clostridia bacterium]